MTTCYDNTDASNTAGKPKKRKTIAPTSYTTKNIDSMDYVQPFSEYDLAELMEMSRIYEDLDTEEFSPNVKLQVKLEMMYVTMRLCTKERYNSFDDYSEYVEHLIDRISKVGFNGLLIVEQLFLPAYAFCLRVLEED